MKPSAITPQELERATRLLEERPDGLARKDLANHFGSDRRGRAVISALAEGGVCAVITTKAKYGDGQVYRIARDAKEVEAEDRELASRIAHLERRRSGLQQAWHEGIKGVRRAQENLL